MNPNEAKAMQKLSQNVEISTLCAFYGGLLTERQRTALQLHHDEDLSLAEVAEQFGVSRQNIHDLIVRSVQKLRRIERTVGAIAQARQTDLLLKRALHAVESARDIAPADCAVAIQQMSEAIALISQTITNINGEE